MLKSSVSQGKYIHEMLQVASWVWGGELLRFIFLQTFFYTSCIFYNKKILQLNQERKSLTLLALPHQVRYFWYTEEDSSEEINLSRDVAHHDTFLPNLSKYLSWTEETI